MDTRNTDATQSTTQSLKNDAADLKDQAVDRAAAAADSRKDQVAGGLKQVSSALDAASGKLEGDETPDWLRQGFAKVAQSVNSLASELEGSDSRELTAKVKGFARQHPGAFLGACAAAGFAAARVFSAGSDTPFRDVAGSDASPTAQNFGGGTVGANTGAYGTSVGSSPTSTYGTPA